MRGITNIKEISLFKIIILTPLATMLQWAQREVK